MIPGLRSFSIVALSLALAVPAAAQSTFETNVVRHGSYNNAIPLPAPNPVACRDICLADAQCVTWTYYKPGLQHRNALCMTRHTVADPYPSGCCVSGIVHSRVRR